MTDPIKFLNASEAAGRLGVTAKALRLYEQRGLISPRRTAAGYRAYGPDESIILCPANHSPPMLVTPYPGASGYEAAATCLASPKVRARVACCPQAA
ncbi:MAG: MerR family transcriptional regulator [Proteobacteria bacterium]|nr:MerR family transcriptional regulator [Pseudomonadota bacterium]